MIINLSQATLFQTCQRKWWYQYHEALRSPRVSDALREGKDWHAVCEGSRPILPSDPVWLREGAAEFAQEWPSWGAEILKREHCLSAPMPHRMYLTSYDHTLIGRLDALVRWNGKLWHLQHKSVRSSQPVACFTALIARDLHEAGYAHLIQHNYPDEEYGGTILAIVRKLTRGPFTSIWPLPIVDVPGRLAEICALADEMESKAAPPIQTRAACMGAWGNSRCYYLPLCEGQVETPEAAGLIRTTNPFDGYPVEFIRSVQNAV